MREADGRYGEAAVGPAPAWYQREVRDGEGVVAGRSLRLLILHWDRYPTARVVYREKFPAMGHRVTWVERGERGQSRFLREEAGGLETILCPYPFVPRSAGILRRILTNRVVAPFSGLRKALWVWGRAKRDRYDFIQARDLVPEALVAWLVARASRTRFAYQLDFPHPEGHLNRTEGSRSMRVRWKRLRWRLQIHVRDFLMRRADLVFVISEAMRTVVQSKGVEERRLHVFPVGVGEHFAEFSERREEVRARLDLGQSPTIVYLGNLAATRDRALILGVIQAVHEKHGDARFIILGKECESLEDVLREWDITDAVAYAGTVPYDEVPLYLWASDVGIYPIDVDVPREVHATMSPLKVAEYMACELATVASPVPEAEQLLRDSQGGLIVPTNSVAGFVGAVDQLCENITQAREMGRRARRYVLRYKEFSQLAKIVANAYQRELGPRANR